MSYDPATGRKFISPAKLIDLLSTLPADFEVESNAVGNLKLSHPERGYAGFIDLNTEDVDVFDIDAWRNA